MQANCDQSTNPYETDKKVNEYMAFHYCQSEDYIRYSFGPKDALDFPKKCAELCMKHKTKGVLSRALDIGCSVGRSSFELCREFNEVYGIDYSKASIAKSQELKLKGEAHYQLRLEGDLVEEKVAKIDPVIDRSKANFAVGDASNLSADLGTFGCVLAGNIIDRLSEPMKFFNRLPQLVVPRGIVVITSPYTWMEEYTPKRNWIGGYVKDGKNIAGIDALKEIFCLHFDLIGIEDIPFLIRETEREYLWTVAQTSVWMRKENH